MITTTVLFFLNGFNCTCEAFSKQYELCDIRYWGCCTPSTSIGLLFGYVQFWGRISMSCCFTKLLLMSHFIMVTTNITRLCPWLPHFNYRLRLSEASLFPFCNRLLSGMFCTWILFRILDWIEHVTIGLLYVRFILSTRGFPGLQLNLSWTSVYIVTVSIPFAPHALAEFIRMSILHFILIQMLVYAAWLWLYNVQNQPQVVGTADTSVVIWIVVDCLVSCGKYRVSFL